MSYHELGDGDDDTYSIISNATDAVSKCARQINTRVGIMATRDSPALRQQVEEAYRRGQEVIDDTKPEIRSAGRTAQLQTVVQEFRDACSRFKEAYSDFRSRCSGSIASISDDPYSSSNDRRNDTGFDGLQQRTSFDLIEDAGDVDEQMRRENEADARRLASDTNDLRETMYDVNQLVGEQGQQLDNLDDMIEEAADTIEDAGTHIEKAREHQKSTIKIKLAIGICCGVTLIVGLFILLWQLHVFDGGGSSPPATTASTTSSSSSSSNPPIALRGLFNTTQALVVEFATTVALNTSGGV